MGMTCGFTSISDETIKLVQKHPVLLVKLTCDEEIFKDVVENRKPESVGFVGKLLGKKPKPLEPVPDYTPKENEGLSFDIDKAWQAIHFLLTGSDWDAEGPLSFILIGTEPLKKWDGDFNPLHAHTSEQIKKIDTALQVISKEDFESRYDPEKMIKKDIYPCIWDPSTANFDALEYLSDNFIELKKYIHRLAELNMGVVVEVY